MDRVVRAILSLSLQYETGAGSHLAQSQVPWDGLGTIPQTASSMGFVLELPFFLLKEFRVSAEGGGGDRNL